MQVLLVVLSAVIGYLFGTIPVGACIARLYGNLDIRKHGSGNTGTTNVLRTLGWVPSLLTLLGDCLKGAFGALIYAVITVTLRGNHTVTGLALTIFGTGLSGTLGKPLAGLALPDSILRAFSAYNVPGLSKIPVLGEMFFQQSVYVQIAPVLAVLLYIYLTRTCAGLSTRAVGENPGAADAAGVNVTLVKYLNIVAGGFLCGMGGAYLSVVFVPRWQENITAGIGWIAVALVIFSTWNPAKAIFGAYFFGALRGVGFKLQNAQLNLFGFELRVSA